MKHSRSLLLIVLILSGLVGCRVGPDYAAPNRRLPTSFAGAGAVASVHAVQERAEKSDSAVPGRESASGELTRWWTVFGDPVLDALAGEAMASNLDLRLARSRVREARALRAATRSAFFPEVGASGSYSKVRQSDSMPTGAVLDQFGQPLENDVFTTGLDLSWEVDVFGGVGRSSEAAQADLEASGEALRDVRVLVLAEVGLGYLELRSAQRRLAVAEANLTAQEQTLALTRDRRQAGLAAELDTARAEAQVAATRARIPTLVEARQRAVHRLSVLLGRDPGGTDARWLEPGAAPRRPPGVPVGLPSDLLLRRPDLRRAEREVAAATARIGVATADLFPRFYLTGAAGLQSAEVSDLFDGGSRFWQVGPSVRWPIFTAGRIRRNIEVQNARQEQALLRYEKAVQRALEEVENALVGWAEEQRRYEALMDAEAASARAAVLAEDRYRSGLVDFLDVLEADRTRLAAQDELVASEHRLAQNLVRLYQALGGGWDPEDTEAGINAGADSNGRVGSRDGKVPKMGGEARGSGRVPMEVRDVGSIGRTRNPDQAPADAGSAGGGAIEVDPHLETAEGRGVRRGGPWAGGVGASRDAEG